MSKYRIRFQVTASPSSREGMVLDYLLAGETPYPLRDMVMLSVQSFWLPLAYRERLKALPAPELEPLIRSCVLRLQMQQQYLQSLSPRPLQTPTFSDSDPESHRRAIALPESRSADRTGEVWDPFA
ncbi:MAG: hypothetical protein AAGB13_03870 [Cyanobacteria bacterium P01_F01_bin.33]